MGYQDATVCPERCGADMREMLFINYLKNQQAKGMG